MDVILDVLARHLPGFDAYHAVLALQGERGHGRLRAAQEGVVFQHLLILRRTMVQGAARDFSDVEKKIAAKRKRLKLGDLDFLTGTIVDYALFSAECTGDVALLGDVSDIIKQWQIS